MSDDVDLAAGKLPADLLASLLAGLHSNDREVRVGPGVGRDVAVIDRGGPDLWLATADPITFATDSLGTYLVAVCCNDIASVAGTPRWLLATVLLPEGTTASAAGALLAGLDAACAAEDVALVGGHTEVTDAVTRPIVSGALIGTVSRDRFVANDGGRVGDAVLCAGEFPIEGLSILARECSPALLAAGVPGARVEAAAALLSRPGISIRHAAEVARDAAPVHAMHDPTEGGLATALHELADAAGTDLEIDASALPLHPLAPQLCAACSLDPLGVIASGALLVACAEAQVAAVLEAWRAAGVGGARIGSLTAPGSGRSLRAVSGVAEPLRRFDADEIVRVLG